MSVGSKDRLSTQERWEVSYQAEAHSLGPKAWAHGVFGRLLGAQTIKLFRDYDEWLLWEVLYPKHLPPGIGRKALEIGSAPGTNLIELHRRFGFEPYGVEYTPSGAEKNRALFSANGLKPENVVEADVFSDEFCSRFRDQFDVVLSRGFIEHFKDPGAVVRTHLALLKRGGTLVIEVPNFRGIYYAWYLFFRRSVLTWHNFETIKSGNFQHLFDLPELEGKFCGSYGTLSLNMFIPPQNAVGRVLMAIRSVPQAMINCGLHVLFKRGGPETALFSPRLLYVGVKK